MADSEVAPADGEPGIDPAAPGFVPTLEADTTATRGLRHTADGVELFDRATDAPLRSYLPGRAVTTWGHAVADRWIVALEGGQVVEVNFATQSIHELATFDGDIHWFSIDRAHAPPVLDKVIADHDVPGVGVLPLLYTLDSNSQAVTARSIDTPFDSIYEDEWGRLWLLPELGVRLPTLHWIDQDTFEVSLIEFAVHPDFGWRRFGGVLAIPDGALYFWGYYESQMRHVEWVGELPPPMFDDVAWQELESFDAYGLLRSDHFLMERKRKLQAGMITLTYDVERSLVLLHDVSLQETWAARPEMDEWVRVWRWEELYHRRPSLLDDGAGMVERRVTPRTVPSLPEGWPSAYLEFLNDDPARRVGQINPDEPTNPLIAGMLRQAGAEVESLRVHISASSDRGWVLGLDNGMVVYHDQETGQFKLAAQVSGIPIDVDFSRNRVESIMRIDYWSSTGDTVHLRRAIWYRFDGDWAELSDEQVAGEWPAASVDRRIVELHNTDEGATTAVWKDVQTEIEVQTIEPGDDLYLVGLLTLPDGRVIGYGGDQRDGEASPVLVDVASRRDGIVWSRAMGHLCEQWPLPSGGFTHAAYIPAAGRLLLVADGRVWSTGLGFDDWRQELPSLPALPALPEGAGDVAENAE